MYFGTNRTVALGTSPINGVKIKMTDISKKQAVNPYLPSWEYVPDAEPRVFGDRVYIYGSHDLFNGADFCLGDYVCWSAPLDNLGDWKYEGVIYKASQDPRNKKGKMHMCAPDCIQGVDGRYYLYYQLHMLSCTGVAVSDSPVGPFEHYGYVQHADGTPWGEKKWDTFAFDPGVLVDDDNRVFLYVGFSPAPGFLKKVFRLRGNRVEESVCLELDKDMKTVISKEMPIVPGPGLAKNTEFDGHAFFEASSIRKINGKYYYVYSSILSHELCYAVSDKPDSDFHFGGTLVSIADIGFHGNTKPTNYTGNTHGGMVEINGQWYIFYHRQTNRIKCSRQACAEKIYIEADGSIKQVEVTSCGPNDGPLTAKGTYEARIACNLNGKKEMVKSDDAKKADKNMELPFFTQSGKDRECDGDQYIANMKDGSWCGFKYFDFKGDESRICVQTRGTVGGVLRVYTDRNQSAIAEINLTAGDDWTNSNAEFSPIRGVTPLFFEYNGNGSIDFNKFTIE